MAINKMGKLRIDIKNKKKFIDSFLDTNDKFEELVQKNIMKDAYIWK